MGDKTGMIEAVVRRERRTDSDAVIDGVSHARCGKRPRNDADRSAGPTDEMGDCGRIELAGVTTMSKRKSTVGADRTGPSPANETRGGWLFDYDRVADITNGEFGR